MSDFVMIPPKSLGTVVETKYWLENLPAWSIVAAKREEGTYHLVKMEDGKWEPIGHEHFWFNCEELAIWASSISLIR